MGSPETNWGPAEMSKITQYKDYWPEYLREHSRPATRLCHYLHTALGGLLILYFIYSLNWIGLIAVLATIFISAFFSHIIFEKNKPAAAKYPFWWSVLNDIRMLMHFMTGTLRPELIKAGVITDV